MKQFVVITKGGSVETKTVKGFSFETLYKNVDFDRVMDFRSGTHGNGRMGLFLFLPEITEERGERISMIFHHLLIQPCFLEC